MKEFKKYYCSKHGDEGEYTCNECFAKLGEFLRDVEEEKGINIYRAGTKDEKERLDL